MNKIAQVVMLVFCALLADPHPTASTESVTKRPATAIVATTHQGITPSDVSRSVPQYTDIGYFLVTAYTSGVESTGKRQGDKGYGITATGSKVQEGRTISADWRILPPGTRVRIEGLSGIYTVEDKGGAIKNNHIDLYISDLRRARDWGKKRLRIQVIN